MKKKIVNSILSLFFIAFIIWQSPNVAYATDTGMAYTYRIEKPDNQLDAEIGYFDLMMTPKQEQKLKINITSLSDKEQTIETTLDSAKTNSNGVIEYNQKNIDKDESMTIDFNNIVTTEKEIVLKPKETKTLEVSIKMPEIAYDGVIAGGLTLKAKDDDTTEKQANGSRVKNEYAYVIAILLRENKNEVKPDLAYRKTYAADRNYNNTIFTRIANSVPIYEANMTLEAQISKSGSKEILYEARQTGIEMAPNSYFDFPISMNNEDMVPGKYVARVNALIGSQSWNWEEEFEITKKDADKYNEKNSALTQESVDWKLILAIVTGFIVIVGIVTAVYYFFVKKKKRANKAQKKKKVNNVQKKKRKSKSDV